MVLVLAVLARFRMQLAHGQPCLATRVSPEQASELAAIFPAARHNATARTIRLAPHDGYEPAGAENGGAGRVVVITAGTGVDVNADAEIRIDTSSVSTDEAVEMLLRYLSRQGYLDGCAGSLETG